MTCVLDQLDVSTRPLKRAQYEAFEFRVAGGGEVIVRNESHTNPDDHVYTVTVADGLPAACTCPADEHNSGACKHRLAVAIREPVLDAARAGAADGTDRDGTDRDDADDADLESGSESGASQEHTIEGTTGDSTSGDAAAARPEDCDCGDDPARFPCWPCVRDGYRELPAAPDTPADD